MKGLFAMIMLAMCLIFPPLGILLFVIWVACEGNEPAARSVPAAGVSLAQVFPRVAKALEDRERARKAARQSLAIKLVASESAEDFIKKI